MLCYPLGLLYSLIEEENLALNSGVDIKFLADGMLYLLVVYYIVLVDYRDCNSRFPGPSCPSNPVDVIFEVLGCIEVDNSIHIGDIKTSSCYIRGY